MYAQAEHGDSIKMGEHKALVAEGKIAFKHGAIKCCIGRTHTTGCFPGHMLLPRPPDFPGKETG